MKLRPKNIKRVYLLISGTGGGYVKRCKGIPQTSGRSYIKFVKDKEEATQFNKNSRFIKESLRVDNTFKAIPV